jgi:hypothetical protein
MERGCYGGFGGLIVERASGRSGLDISLMRKSWVKRREVSMRGDFAIPAIMQNGVIII